MEFIDRLKIFAVGFTIGLVLLFFILSKRQADEVEVGFPETIEEIQREAVPGILQAYEERRVVMDSKFIVEQRRTALPDKAFQRTLLLRGKDPGQELIVIETAREVQGIELADRVKVIAPDRLLVTLAGDTTTADLYAVIRENGYHLLGKGEAPDTVLVGLPEIGLAEHRESIAYLASLASLVASVAPVIYGETNITDGQ